VRAALVVVLACGLVGALATSWRTALMLGSLALLLTFLLGAGKLAADVIELRRSDLVADGLVVAIAVVGLLQTAGGSRALIAGLLALALAAQVAAAVARRRAAA
jgi:hypothetical protein